MIIVLPFGTNCPKTDKQNIIRPQVYRQFEALISHKYEGVEESEIVGPLGGVLVDRLQAHAVTVGNGPPQLADSSDFNNHTSSRLLSNIRIYRTKVLPAVLVLGFSF
jgi:hypothetical protein